VAASQKRVLLRCVLLYWMVEMRWPNTAKCGMVEMELDWLPMVAMRIQKFVNEIQWQLPVQQLPLNFNYDVIH
jgi:hypothetical protein